MSYAPPAGLPPSQRTGASAANSALEATTEDDPPPAYTPSADVHGHTSVASGPSRPDFSGPPPMPDRLMEQNITGVGVGYGHGHGHGHGHGSHGLGQQNTGQGWGVTPQPTGATNVNAGGSGWGAPPQHPSRTGSSFAHSSNTTNPFSSPQDDSKSSATAAGSRPPPPSHIQSQSHSHSHSHSQLQDQQLSDMSPTETPTPGRPLLHRCQILVYPKGFWCTKCSNTGYKNNDPSNPHESDWRKYGKHYNSALAHSYTISVDPSQSNPSTSSSANFQRPLPSFAPAGMGTAGPGPSQSSYGHLPPPPQPQSGKWNTYPGQMAPPPPPPQHPQMFSPHQYGSQQMFVQATPGPAPPGALIVQPGDPRIGGRLCYKCNGSGRGILFFGLDDGRCYDCGGLGRLF